MQTESENKIIQQISGEYWTKFPYFLSILHVRFLCGLNFLQCAIPALQDDEEYYDQKAWFPEVSGKMNIVLIPKHWVQQCPSQESLKIVEKNLYMLDCSGTACCSHTVHAPYNPRDWQGAPSPSEAINAGLLTSVINKAGPGKRKLRFQKSDFWCEPQCRCTHKVRILKAR